MIANLKHAARNNETVTIGGGEFNAREIRDFVELIELLTDQLYAALPFVEDAETDPCYKQGLVTARIKAIKAVLERIES